MTISQHKVYSQAREVASDIRLTRQLAITEKITYELVIDTYQNRYWIFALRDNKETYKRSSLGNGLRFGSLQTIPERRVYFTPAGNVSPGGTISITDGRTVYYVIIMVATGRVRVSQTPP
jgi:Tfp pilus assembly protein FimT